MPFLGWTISKIFELPDFFAVGLILVSCCPGGTASNVIAYLSNLNVAFSVSMTFISTVTGVILTPLLITNISGELINVNLSGLLLSATKVVLLPVFLGLIVSRYFPSFTKRMVIYSPLVSVVLIVLIVASIIGEGKEIIFQSGINLLISVMILHLLGFILGYIISFGFLRDRKLSKTICIEIGMQNSGLGVVLAKENYANPSIAIPSAISSLVHSIYGSIFVSIFKERK
jgi:BASS family bile acid:Na+ symporter